MTPVTIALFVYALTALVAGITTAHHYRALAKESGRMRHALTAIAGAALFITGIVASYVALNLWRHMAEYPAPPAAPRPGTTTSTPRYLAIWLHNHRPPRHPIEEATEMSHYPAFVITSLELEKGRIPSDTELRRAAREAQETATAMIAAMDPADEDKPRPESLSLGGNTYRFVQGNEDTNSDTFAGMPRNQWPTTTFQFWSDRNGTFADASEAPHQILDWCWNTSSNLVTLALESNPKRRRIYPALLLIPGQDLPLHHLRYQDNDVFGDAAPEMTASRYLEGDPVMAWHRAKAPLQELAEAAFRVDYLKALQHHADRLVIELDWNM